MSNKNESKDCLINKLNTLQENFEKDTKELREQINAIDKCSSLTYKDVTDINVAEDILKDLKCCEHIKFTENQFCRKIDWITYKLETVIKAVNYLCNTNKIWNPDFINSNEYKYSPYFYMGDGSFSYHFYNLWHSSSAVRVGLLFKEKEAMLFIVDKHLNDYKFYHTGK